MNATDTELRDAPFSPTAPAPPKRMFSGILSTKPNKFLVKLNPLVVALALGVIVCVGGYYVLYSDTDVKAPSINLKQLYAGAAAPKAPAPKASDPTGVSTPVQAASAASPVEAAASQPLNSLTPAAAVTVQTAPMQAGSAASPSVAVAVAAQVASMQAASAASPASSPSTQTHATDRLELAAIPTASSDGKSATKSSNDDIIALYSRVGELEVQMHQLMKLVAKQQRTAKATPKTPAPSHTSPENIVALTVVDITPKKAFVSDSTRTYVVEQGSSMPGGAVFLSYDEQTKIMRTDRGNFVIN